MAARSDVIFITLPLYSALPAVRRIQERFLAINTFLIHFAALHPNGPEKLGFSAVTNRGRETVLLKSSFLVHF
jgi:hypothetical protein